MLGRTEFYRRHSAPIDLATAVVGAPITVIVVRNIAGRVTGCSLGISADWVIVQASLFDRSSRTPTTRRCWRTNSGTR